MKKDTIIRLLKETIDERGRTNIELLEPEVVTQIANAYVSGVKGLLQLYSKEDVAKYYETTETVVSKCIDRAIEFHYLKFATVRRIIQNSGDNERRHAVHRGLTQSEKRYAVLVQRRFEYFKKTFEEKENQAKYNSAYKMYLGQSTLVKVMGSYGLSPEEMRYLLIRKACTDMTEVEFMIFCRHFYNDYLGTPAFHKQCEFITAFRKKMEKNLSKLQALREKGMEESDEFQAVHSEIVDEFEKY